MAGDTVGPTRRRSRRASDRPRWRARLLASSMLGVFGCAESGQRFAAAEGMVADTEACGELRCTDGLRVSLVAQGGIITAGSYEIVVEADDATEGCGFVVEGPGDACGLDKPCLVLDECELTPGFSTIPHTLGFVVPQTPAVVDLSVLRNRSPVAGESLAPQYAEHAPNGADCPPVCQIAAAEVALR